MELRLSPTYIEVHGKRGGVVAVVDREDGHLAKRRWHRNVRGYIISAGDGPRASRRLVYLHRCVLGLTQNDGMEGDHKNGDKLHNTRDNLRPVTRAQQMQNIAAHGALKTRGVSFVRATGRYEAAVGTPPNRHRRHFDTAAEAAQWAREMRRATMPFSVDRR